MAVKRRYTVIIEEEDGHVGALAPDGIALGLGDTVDEAREDLRAGIAAVIASYIEAGESIPEATTTVEQARRDHPDALVEEIEVEVPETADARGASGD